MDIRIVESAYDKQQVFKFRYSVYIEEMQRPQKYCDHKKKMIQEPLDETARIFAAFDSNNEVIGTCRLNYARDGNLGIYSELYSMYEIGLAHPKYTSITTKLIISKSYRKTKLVKELCCAVYKKHLQDNIFFNHIDTNSDLVNFYEKFGYKLVRDIFHPEYGYVVLMKLDSYDVNHLKSVKSPFYPILLEHTGQKVEAEVAA